MNSVSEGKKQELSVSKENGNKGVEPKANGKYNKNYNGGFGKSAATRSYNQRRQRGNFNGRYQGSRRAFLNNSNRGWVPANARKGPRFGQFRRWIPRRPVFAFLGGVQQNNIAPENLKNAEAISAQILTLQRPKRPLTAFGLFFAEAQKADPKKDVGAIRKEWSELPEKDKQAKIEANWNEFQAFKEKVKDYGKKIGEYEAKLQLLQGLQPLRRREAQPRGFDLFWKDVEPTVKAGMPNASAYELMMKHKSLWKSLPEKEKQLYIVQSQIGIEKAAHEFKMTTFSNKIQDLKNKIEEDKKVQEVSVKAA